MTALLLVRGLFLSWWVALMPDIPGIAKSITITSGLNLVAISTAA